MRVAILTLNAGRGSGEVARQHARELLSTGNSVTFMHPRIGRGVDGADNMDIALAGAVVPVHEYLPSARDDQKAVSTMSFDEAMSYLPAYEGALTSVASQTDIFLGHHANLSAVAVHRVARAQEKPFVLFLHGTGIEPRHTGGYDDGVWQQIEAAIHAAAGIIVTTEYVRDQLVLPLVNVPHERFLILPCGIDTREFHPDATGDIRAHYQLDEVFVICPGALTTAKGPQNVVAASHAYADLAQTIFIGDGNLRGQLEAELGERGRLLGFVSAEHKAQLINAATILAAAPEKREHFGIIYAEAMAGGTVPVAYDGGGVPSIVTPDTGVLTQRDPAALGRAVRALLEEPDRVSAMAAKGRERAVQHFESTALGTRLVEWLRGLAR